MSAIMTNLRVLIASGDSEIDDKGIEQLNLIKLNTHNNPKITL